MMDHEKYLKGMHQVRKFRLIRARVICGQEAFLLTKFQQYRAALISIFELT